MKNNCDCRNDCLIFSLAAAILVGVITAILRFTAIITVTPAFLWATFGIAVVYLALLLVTSLVTNDFETAQCSRCRVLTTLLLSLLGTILFSVILLAVTFAATSSVGALLNGILLGFFTLALASSACLVKRC